MSSLCGQPRIYATPEDLQADIDKYFAKCKLKKARPKVIGLALALDFCDRQSLYDYKHSEDTRYSCVVKRAISRVAEWHEGESGAGSIFWLKNHGWTDARDVNIGGQADNQLNINVNFSDQRG
jgi:hypothetical protein